MAEKIQGRETNKVTPCTLASIFFTFLKISPLTFGGGITMVPHIENEMVRKRKWFTTWEIPEILAVAQSAPGSIAINASIYIGFKVKGVKGSISAILGMLLPASTITILLTYLVFKFQDFSLFSDALAGIRPAIIGLIFFAAFKIGRTSITNANSLLIFFLAGCLLAASFSPIGLIAGGGAAGLVTLIFHNKRKISC
ncbi:chromate transporter [Halobacillus salinarum]|uniref:Chromate transporter n=1 Tax=Halobacillus salinarum TaxID=2932257 RepID=A0ABY4EEI7_9BACI|nr:chromate transporter [Halobacillus salinarum]UOQ42877.1 chromate transporter [Halobacillus salinarum]